MLTAALRGRASTLSFPNQICLNLIAGPPSLDSVPTPSLAGQGLCKSYRERQTSDRKVVKAPKIDARSSSSSPVFNRKCFFVVKIAFLSCKKMKFSHNSLHRKILFRWRRYVQNIVPGMPY
jgi:hypothetical protein